MSVHDDNSDGDDKPRLSEAAILALKTFLREEGNSDLKMYDSTSNCDAEDSDGDVLDAVKLLIKSRRNDDDTDSTGSDFEEDKVVIKYDTYERLNMSSDYIGTQPRSLKLALVAKHHSLWAEYVYNAARVVRYTFTSILPPYHLANMPTLLPTSSRCIVAACTSYCFILVD
jgi:hypothetical protein